MAASATPRASTEAALAGKRVAAMATARVKPSATELADGRILVTGGSKALTEDHPFASAEIYDAKTDRWTTVAPMAVGRIGHRATLMTDGRVLVTGGKTGLSYQQDYVRTAEIFDPATGAWSPASAPPSQRKDHAAVTLADGRVFVVGGFDPTSGIAKTAELYDPACDTWSSIATNQLYSMPTAVVLDDGRALVLTYMGYVQEVKQGTELRGDVVGEIFDPAKATWQPIAKADGAGQQDIRVRIAGNKIERCGAVIVGGSASRPVTCHVFDPAANRWRKK
jgi:hypothetical protein